MSASFDGTEQTHGLCHICKEVKPISYCPVCDHYFCPGCRGRWWSRGAAFIKQMVGGRKPDCCGPEARVAA